MRLPQPEMVSDPLLDLVGRRIVATVDGQRIKGRMISFRGGFVTIQEDRSGPRTTVNKWAISMISEESRPVSRSPKITKMFWK
jgi:hypothetical protein